MKIRLHSLSALSLPFASTILLANLIFATGAFGQITQVTGSPQTTSTTSTTLTITKPSGLAVGDLMIANILQSDDDGGGINLSNASASGWTVLAGNSIGAGSSNEWWGTLLFKIANASDVAASSFSFTLDSDANDGNVGGLVAFSGVDTGLPFDAVGVFNTGDSDDLTAPSITTSVANAAVVMFGMVGDNRTMQNTGWNTGTPGSLTLTELFDETSSSGPDEAVSAAWTIKASAGATGDGDGEIDDSGNDFWGALLVALRPAGISLTSPLTLAYGGTLTVPPNVNCIRVQVWGGGGGGGNESANGSDGGGGGGGGGYAEGILLVTPGDNLTITVGGGGAGAVNTSGANGMAGGNSVVTHSSGTLTATGGGAGLGVMGSGGVGSGGSGSFSGSVYGQLSFSGGDGGEGDGNEGGGGGGGAGSTGNGGDGSNPGGGSGGSGSGGNGGDGGDDGAGSNGAFIGGGGGSAGDDAGGGGNGAAGRVIVSWGLSSSTPGTITAGTPASSCTSPFNPPNISGDNPSGSETWSWQSSTDGGATWTTISGATSASYNPGNITTTTQFRRLRSVAGECPGISNVVVYTVATPTAAPGNVSLCIGQTVMMNGNPSGGTTPYNSHAWVVINGGSTGLGTGDLTNNNDGTVTINGAGATGAGNAILRYTVTDANGCSAQVTGTATVNAVPTAVISGALSFCAGGSTTLTASGGSSYEWDDNSANAMRTISAAGTYTVTVTAGNGCTDTETATVTENPLPTAVISGTLSFCAGGSTTLTASGGTTYLWDDNSTNAMRTISAAGTYTVQVTDGNGCTDTETATVTEVSVPACNITSGPTSVCPNSTGHMYTATGGGTYLWNVSGNGAIDGGNTGSAVTVDAGAAGTYTITVTVTAGGCTSSCSQTVNVEDNTLPTITCPANITVNTPSNSCEATGVALGSPVVSDNCSTTVSNDASEPYALGNTIVTWMVSDGTNSAVCLQTVKVNPYVAPPGEYFDLGTCQSTPCPPGTYCPGGTTAGIPCPAGTSQGLSGQQSCVDCPAGSYSSSIGAIECTACAAGTYNDMSGATSCTACPYGTSSMAGATSCTPLDPQHITVFGNSIQIANRANTTSGADHTDFGAVNVGNMVTRTFTIYNIVNAVPLKLSGNPSVEIADKNASDFSVTLQPSTPIAGGGSTTFTVKFQPTATGLRTAIVMIASDDYPENPFVFTIEGTGL